MPAHAGIHDFCPARGDPGIGKRRLGLHCDDRPNGLLYTGVTADLVRRISEHRAGEIEGFSKRHDCKRLVYFERHDEIVPAIAREKAMKKWRRAWKVRLIGVGNPAWDDLYDGIL